MALIPFDGELDTQPSGLAPFSGKLDGEKGSKQNSGIAGDTLTGLKRGVEQIPGMLTGIAEIAAAPVSAATGINRPFSRAADWFGEKTGFQPGKWAEEAGQEYSPELQQQLRNVEEAKGFFPTIGAIAQNPRVAANLVAESLPSTIAGGLLARGAMGAVAGAEKLAAMKAAGDTAGLLKAGAIAGGIGEGAVTAGQQMAQTDYNVDPLLAAGTSLASGAITGAIGAGSGRLANSAIGKKLGLSDLETSIAAGTLGQNAGKAGALGYAKRIGAGAAQEGLLEEAPQSYQEQVWQNIANGKPWNEGAAEAAAQGAVAGGLMGGGINAIPRATPPQDQAPANPLDAPPANPNVVDVPTATGSVPVDRTAGPMSAAVHVGAQSGAIETAQSTAGQDPFERLATLELLSEQRDLTPQETAEANALSAQLDSTNTLDSEQPTGTAAAAPIEQPAAPSVASQESKVDPKIVERRAQNYYEAGNAAIDAGNKEEGLRLMAKGDEILRSLNSPTAPARKTPSAIAAPAQQSAPNTGKLQGAANRDKLSTAEEVIGREDQKQGVQLAPETPSSGPAPSSNIGRIMQTRTDQQLESIASNESANVKARQAATAEIQRRATAPAQPTTSPIAQTATQLNVPDAARVAKSSPLAQKTEEANAPQVGIEQGAAQGQGVAGVHSKQASAAPQQEENIRLQKVIASLQNRSHRDSAASAAQMSRIAGNPDPDLLMASPTMGDGAPVVTALHNSASIPEEFLGASGQITTAKRKIPFRYALVEASSLSPSHFADGRRNVEYATDNGKLTTITNGRSAGIIEAYARGTTGKYRAALEQTDASYGFQAGKAAGMKEPVIVRMIQSDQLTDDIGDESNVSGQLGLSATEQARNDAARFDATSVEYTEDGRPTDSSMRGFIAAMPEGERQQLAPDGRPTKQAIDRLNAAVFHSAYEDAELVEMMAQSAEEEVKTLMAALSKTSGAMAKLNEAGDLDIRRLVVGAARKIINASRNGITAAKFIKQGDLLDGSAEQRIAEFIARNIRSAKRMSEALADAAEFAYAESLRSGVDMFGENIPTASRNDVVERITNADLERRNEGLEQPGRRQPDVGDARRKAADQGRPGDAGIAQANEPEAGYNADKILEGYDQQSLNEREQRVRNAERAAKLVQDQLDREEKARLDRLEIARRSKGAASDFELGGDAINNLAGQQSLFSTARKYDTKTIDLFTSQLPARPGEDTAASRSDRIVVAARALVRGSRGSLLGLALNADWIKGKGSSLLGKRVTSAADLATLAAVLRDPKAETMRYFLVKGDQIVYHTAVSSRLAGSSSAFVGDQQQFLNGIKAAMDRLGADGYYLMHNHPSRLVKASDADLNLTAWIANRLPGFKEHIILDHTEFGLIQMAGGGKAKYADYLGARQLAKEGPDPTRNASPEHAALNGRITAFTDFAKYADAVRSNDNVVLVAVDTQLTINGIMEVSKDDMKAGSLTAYKNMVRLKRASGADAMFAVLPPSMKFGDLNKSITNSAWLIDVNHQKQGRGKIIAVSAAQYGQMLGGRGVSSRHDRTGVVDAPRAYYGEADLFADMARAEREEIAAASSKGSPQMDMFAMFDSVQPEAKKSPQKAQQEAQTGAQKETAPQREATPAPEAAKAQNWPGDLFGNEQKQERGEPAEQKPAQEASQKEEAKPVSDAEKSFDFMLKNKSMRTYHELNNERLKGEYRSGYFEGYEGNPFPEGAIKSRAMDDGYLFGRRIGEQDRTGFGKDENGNKIKVTSTVKKTEESGPAAVDAKKEAETGPYSFDEHKDFRRRLFDGGVSADELKATYRRYLDSQESLKSDLNKKTLKELAPNGTGGRNKGEIVDILVSRLAGVFNISDEGISYSPLSGETYSSALGKRVASFTQADMDKFVQSVSESRSEREEAKTKALASAENPQTLDDYRNLVALKGEDALTAEQKRHREDLKAEKSMTERAAQEKAKPVVAAVAQTTGSEIRQTKHTKTGEDLYVVVPAARVESDTYKTWNAAAKKLGGWYSSFRGAGAIPGFQFKSMENAEAFQAYISDGNTDAAQAAANERSAERKEETSGNAVERLTAMADRIEESANADLNRDRRTNTARRARMASGAEAAARKQAALAQTMRNLAGAIESGEAKFLGGLRTKAQIEQLMSAVQSAHDDMLRAKYPSYGDFLKHQGEKATEESVDKAKFPVYEAFVDDLMGIADKLAGRDGSKLLAAKLRKVVNETLDAEYADVVKANPLKFALFKQGTLEPAIFGTEVAAHAAMARSKQVEASMQVVTIGRGKHVVTVSRGFAIADKRFVPGAREKITLNPSVAESMIAAVESYSQGKSNYDKVTLGWWLPEVQVRRRRLAAMNIKNGFEYRAALREFIKFREEAKEADKTKELERALIGKNVGVDFFPTPAGVAADMVQRAGIEPDMAVLEPSAGNGNIAEAIKAAGADPDTAEISGDLRELLEAKGFNVVASDFFGMSPRDFTYGDVFRAPDGQLGVMRGSGGMGSGRVGFLPLDANGAPDRSARTWQDRDELVGAEKRGSESGYDRIVMNPPFGNGADIDHVRHAFSLLKPGGRIVSIVGEGAFTRSDKKATEFRDWLESLGAEIESLPENTFRDPKLMATTGANARIVTIDKPETKETDKGTALYSRSNGEEQSTMQKAQATSIIDRILGDKATKTLIGAGLIRMVDSEAQIPGGGKLMTAYHGSPHDHDGFNSANIGTGEGAQAYGWGHYFAGAREVAEWYRKGLSRKDFINKARDAYSEFDDPDSALELLLEDNSLSAAQKELLSALQADDWLGFDYPHQAIQAAFKEPENFDLSDRTKAAIAAQGRLYTVDLKPSEDEYLLWDKPLSEQSENVKAALEGNETIAERRQKLESRKHIYTKSVDAMMDMSGQELYELIADNPTTTRAPGDKAASEYLKSIGIRGIKYLDGSSRSAGGGNYNYVIFDDADIEITRKESNSGQVLGATMPDGTIYLNLGALNEGNIAGVFKHEGFHASARSWLGEETYSALMKRLEQLRNVAQSKMAQGRALSAWYEKANAAIPQDTREQDKPEELAGYAIEMHANGTEQPSVIRKWVEDFLSALRTAIIKHMPNGKVKLWALNNLKPQDLARMAVAGMKAKAQGQLQAQAREAMAYSQSLPATINVDGIDRPATNSNGKPIHPTEEGIRNFWKWFAGSKVVDAQGRPLVVYHSSLEDIERFNKTGKFMGHTGTSGISVTDNPEMANRYLDRYGTTRYDGKLFDKNMMALYVKAENPLYRDEPFQTNLRLGAPLPSGYVSPAVRLGYDSLIRSDAISRKGIVKHSDAKNAVKGREIVVFSPEQIKSAIGNNGDFDPSNPDIRYSRAQNPTLSHALDLVSNLTGPSAKTFGSLRNVQTQLHKARKDPKHFGKVFNLAMDFRTGVSRSAYRAWEAAKDILPAYDNIADATKVVMRGNKASKELGRVSSWIFDGTTDGGGNPLDGVRWTPEQLRTQFNATEKEIGLYEQARNAIDSSLIEVANSVAWKIAKPNISEAMADKVKALVTGNAAGAKRIIEASLQFSQNYGTEAEQESTQQAIEAVGKVYEQAQALIDAGYAPLSRFGRYTVDVFEVGADGNMLRDSKGTPSRLLFQKFEFESEAKAAERQLKKEYADNHNVVIKRGVQAEKTLFAGVDPETVALFVDQVAEIPGLDIKREVLDEWRRNAVSQRSALMHHIKRKGIQGYSEDLPRVLASFLTSNARYASSNFHMADMQKAISDIPDTKGDVRDEAQELFDYINAQNEPGAWMRGLMFAWYLGGSPAAAAVNLTQPVLMTLPYLSQFGSATKHLLSSVRQAMQPKMIPASLKDVMTRATEDGLVEAQEIHHLYDAGMKPIIARIPGGESLRARAQGAATLWGAMFGMAENFNRRITFLSAYKMGKEMGDAKLKEKGFADAYEFAKLAVEETQGIYAKENRPNWARGNGSLGAVGVAAFTFKQFSIQYVELLSRMAKSGPEGKKSALLMLGLLVLASGIQGGPGADDLDDLIDTVLQSMGYVGNVKKAKRDFLKNLAGERIADIVMYGLSVETPIDLQSRLGLGNLFPATGVFKPSENNKAGQLAEIFGPPGGMGKAVGEFVDATQSGQQANAFAALSPVFIRNIAKAMQMAETGEYRDSRGRKVESVDMADAIIKGIGFQPQDVATSSRRAQMVRQDIARVRDVESDIASIWAQGIAEGDKDQVSRARERLADWNASNPQMPIRINMQQIFRRVREMKTERSDRLERTAPRELRGYVRDALN